MILDIGLRKESEEVGNSGEEEYDEDEIGDEEEELSEICVNGCGNETIIECRCKV